MSVAAVTAIIGATVGVASLGLGVLGTAISAVKGINSVGGIFVNRTRFKFTQRVNTGRPLRGNWADPPEAKVQSAAQYLEEEMDTGKSEEEAINAIREDAIKLTNFYSFFVLKQGKALGVGRCSSLVVYDAEIPNKVGDKKTQMSIACYIFKGPRGYWAGVNLSKDNEIGNKADGDGKTLITEINGRASNTNKTSFMLSSRSYNS